MAVTTEWTVPHTNRTVYSGLAVDTKPADPVSGSVFYETDTDKIYTYDGAEWVQSGTSMAPHFHLATLISGEDQANDVLKVEEQSNYTNITATTTDIGTGPCRLKGILVASHSSGTIKVWDNTAASTTVLVNTITLPAIATVGILYIDFHDVLCTTGLSITIGGTVDCTVFWS